MKIILKSFNKFLLQIWNDIMLSVVIFVPIILGLVFKFGIPFLEKYLCSKLNVTSFLADYYVIFDILLMFIPSLMFCFACVMVILEQLDTGISKYLTVTPLGKSGYIISEIGLPFAICYIYTIILCLLFKLSDMSLINIIFISIISILNGLFLSLLIIGFSHNKIEGLALTKFSVFFIMGSFVPFFVTSDMKYLCSLLPSFWTGEFLITNNYLLLLLSFILSIFICIYSYKKFEHKII